MANETMQVYSRDDLAFFDKLTSPFIPPYNYTATWMKLLAAPDGVYTPIDNIKVPIMNIKWSEANPIVSTNTRLFADIVSKLDEEILKIFRFKWQIDQNEIEKRKLSVETVVPQLLFDLQRMYDEGILNGFGISEGIKGKATTVNKSLASDDPNSLAEAIANEISVSVQALGKSGSWVIVLPFNYSKGMTNISNLNPIQYFSQYMTTLSQQLGVPIQVITSTQLDKDSSFEVYLSNPIYTRVFPGVGPSILKSGTHDERDYDWWHLGYDSLDFILNRPEALKRIVFTVARRG